MGSEMKPCPFCGGDLILVEDRGDNGCEKLLYRPQCRKCGGGLGGHYSKATAIAAWNRRSEPRGDSPLAPEGAPQLASGGNRDLEPSSAAGAWVTVPREPTPEMVGAFWRVKNGHHFHDEPPPTDTSDYAAYRAMIASAPKAEVEGWRPINEAPRDGTWLHLWWPGMPIHLYPTVGFAHDGDGWNLAAVDGYDDVEPTHWRPLPAPPATRDGADEPHLVEASTERAARSHTDPTSGSIVKPRRKG